MVGPGLYPVVSRENIPNQSGSTAEQSTHAVQLSLEIVKENFMKLGCFKPGDAPVIDRESGRITIEERIVCVSIRRAWEKAFDPLYIRKTFEFASNYIEEINKRSSIPASSQNAGTLDRQTSSSKDSSNIPLSSSNTLDNKIEKPKNENCPTPSQSGIASPPAIADQPLDNDTLANYKLEFDQFSPYFCSAMKGVITIWRKYYDNQFDLGNSYLNSYINNNMRNSLHIAEQLADIILDYFPKLLPASSSLYGKVWEQIIEIQKTYALNQDPLAAKFEQMINFYTAKEKAELKRKENSIKKKRTFLATAAQVKAIFQKAKIIPQSLRRKTKKNQKSEAANSFKASKNPKIKASTQRRTNREEPQQTQKNAIDNRMLMQTGFPDSDLDFSMNSELSASESETNCLMNKNSLTLTNEILELTRNNLKGGFYKKTGIDAESLQKFEEKLKSDRLIRSTSESFLCFNFGMIEKIRVRNEAEKQPPVSVSPILNEDIDEWEEDLSKSSIVSATNRDPLTQPKSFIPYPEGPYQKRGVQKSHSVMFKAQSNPPIKKVMAGGNTKKTMDQTAQLMSELMEKRRNTLKGKLKSIISS
jgi:hypothetical protein